jgi:hypothetical protein
LLWIVAQGINIALIEPGKPWQNGVTERASTTNFATNALASNGSARAPRQRSLGYLTPNEFMAQHTNTALRHATRRVAGVSRPSRSSPLHHLLRAGQMHEATFQANRGPKKPGRSDRARADDVLQDLRGKYRDLIMP